MDVIGILRRAKQLRRQVNSMTDLELKLLAEELPEVRENRRLSIGDYKGEFIRLIDFSKDGYLHDRIPHMFLRIEDKINKVKNEVPSLQEYSYHSLSPSDKERANSMGLKPRRRSRSRSRSRSPSRR